MFRGASALSGEALLMLVLFSCNLETASSFKDCSENQSSFSGLFLSSGHVQAYLISKLI